MRITLGIPLPLGLRRCRDQRSLGHPGRVRPIRERCEGILRTRRSSPPPPPDEDDGEDAELDPENGADDDARDRACA
jgi:hypothetical protein